MDRSSQSKWQQANSTPFLATSTALTVITTSSLRPWNQSLHSMLRVKMPVWTTGMLNTQYSNAA
jgi:hypothetical protein